MWRTAATWIPTRVGGALCRPRVPGSVANFRLLHTEGGPESEGDDNVVSRTQGEGTNVTSASASSANTTKETRRGLTAKLLEGLLVTKNEKSGEAPVEKSVMDFLEGPRLDIFPEKKDILQNSVPTEGERIENWRQKLATLSSMKEAEALAEMNQAKIPTMQEFFGDKYGNLSDPFNRKLYDNDTNAAPDIRKACELKDHGVRGLPLEEQLAYFNKMILESEATNKLDLCRALPLLMCSNKWSMRVKEEVLRDNMEGVVDAPRQERLAKKKAKNEKWFAHIRTKKSEAAEEKKRLSEANLYELQRERDEELDMDDEDLDVDWRAEAETKRRETVAKRAAAKAAHYNNLKKKKSEAAKAARGKKFGKK